MEAEGLAAGGVYVGPYAHPYYLARIYESSSGQLLSKGPVGPPKEEQIKVLRKRGELGLIGGLCRPGASPLQLASCPFGTELSRHLLLLEEMLVMLQLCLVQGGIGGKRAGYKTSSPGTLNRINAHPEPGLARLKNSFK